MCRRPQPLIALCWVMLMIPGCHDGGGHDHSHGDDRAHGHEHAHKTPTEQKHTHGKAGSPRPPQAEIDHPHGGDSTMRSARDSLVVTDGILLPDGNAMLLVLNNPPGDAPPNGPASKTVLLFLGRADHEGTLTGSWTVAAPGRVDRRETQIYGATDLHVILRDREEKPTIRTSTERLTRGPNGPRTSMFRQADPTTRFYRQITRITPSSMVLALNQLSRVAGSTAWRPTVKQQTFVSVGLRTPAEDARNIEGIWRSVNLSGAGVIKTWTLTKGRYQSRSGADDSADTGEGIQGRYRQGEDGWAVLTPDGDAPARLHALLDSAGGFGLVFHAGLTLAGVLQTGEGIYDGSSFWWRPGANEEKRDISGSWRVFGRLLSPTADGDDARAQTTAETYAGTVEIDKAGALSGTLGYWGTPPWITLEGEVSFAGGPSGFLEVEIPLDLRGHTKPTPDAGLVRGVGQGSGNGHTHPHGGPGHQ